MEEEHKHSLTEGTHSTAQHSAVQCSTYQPSVLHSTDQHSAGSHQSVFSLISLFSLISNSWFIYFHISFSFFLSLPPSLSSLSPLLSIQPPVYRRLMLLPVSSFAEREGDMEQNHPAPQGSKGTTARLILWCHTDIEIGTVVSCAVSCVVHQLCVVI